RRLLLPLVLILVGCERFDHTEALRTLANDRERIQAVGDEFVSRIPGDHVVTVEFNGRRTVDFHVAVRGASWDDPKRVQVWDVSETHPEVTRGLAMLGWTLDDLRALRTEVRSAGGIGISGPLAGGGFRLRHKRVGMGMYTFVLADKAMVADSLLGFDGCSVYYIDAHTAMEYGGGAVGSDCMPPPETW
ncbi:MAG: hypothetical protein AAFQ43_04195, partial [Bacteroidota bacterium]